MESALHWLVWQFNYDFISKSEIIENCHFDILAA